jgi:site-specific recombinase XerD
MATTVTAIAREHVEAFIEDILERRKPSTAHTRYGALRVFFRWCVEEGEITEKRCRICDRRKSPKNRPRCARTTSEPC